MQKSNIFIQKIPHHFVGEDCIQTMMSHKDAFTVLSKDGILYHYEPSSENYINQYLEDERRKQFPYSSIPTHKEIICFSKCMVTNQLHNFDEPYIRIYNNNIVESFAVKDQDEALLIKKIMPRFKRVGYRARQEVEEMFKQPIDKNKHLYIFNLNGSINQSSELLSEQGILNGIKETYLTQFQYYQKNTNFPFFGENQLKYFQYYMDNMNIDNLPNITEDGYISFQPLILVQTDENDISIECISISFMKKDLYRVEIIDMPVTKYTLEQIKDMKSPIMKTKEPKILLRLNPTIKKEEIKKEKQKVKTLQGQKSQF